MAELIVLFHLHIIRKQRACRSLSCDFESCDNLEKEGHIQFCLVPVHQHPFSVNHIHAYVFFRWALASHRLFGSLIYTFP